MTPAMKPALFLNEKWRCMLQLWLLLISLLLLAKFLAYSLPKWHWANGWLWDDGGLIVGRDFLNLWLAGKAAWHADPGRFYDFQTYNGWLQTVIGTEYPAQQWSYPPTLFWLAAPFGLLPYAPAYAIWLIAGLGFLLFRLWRARARWSDMALLLCSPAALFGLLSGQACFLITGATIAIFHWLDRRPLLAGCLIGCLSLKPQVGLLFPLFLIASRRWRVFASAAATTLALAGGVVLIHGFSPWLRYIAEGIPAQNSVLESPPDFIAAVMPTVFMDAHRHGASYGPGMALQLISSALAVIAVAWRAYRRPADPNHFLLFTAAGVAASPYLMAYDLLPFSWAAILLMRRSGGAVPAWLAGALCLFLPVVYFLASMQGVAGVSLTPWLMIACCLLTRNGENLPASPTQPKNSRALTSLIG